MKGGGFIETDSINISAFQQFCGSNFSLWERTKNLEDSRPRPQIPTWQIYEGVLLGGIFRKRSFLQIDQLLRQRELKRFLKSDRVQVASDTEIPLVLSLMNEEQLRALNYLIYGRAKQSGLLQLKDPLLSGLRVGVMDGSCFGRFWAVCFEILSDPPIFLDFQPMAKRGKELPTSKKLLARLVKRFGKSFIDLILLDGLYVSKDHINQALRAGIDVLIKTDEEGLSIIEDAEGIFNQWENFKETVSYERGVDEERLVEYEIWSAAGFKFPGVGQDFKVARVREQNLKTGEVITFWVLTTRQGLSGEQMRELAHRRWSIENNGFKQLNEQTYSKHIWSHDEEVCKRLLWVQMMAVNLLGLFERYLEIKGIKVSRLTRAYLSDLLSWSLIREMVREELILN